MLPKGWVINGSTSERYKGNLNIRRDGLDAPRLISELRGIAFSAGSACASGSGRPSHVLHTFWVGNLRLVLDAVLTSGKQHTSGHAKAAMARLLDELGDKAPALVRGDCGYGNEDIIDVCEQRSLSYLLRLRKTANVKRLIERLFRPKVFYIPEAQHQLVNESPQIRAQIFAAVAAELDG